MFVDVTVEVSVTVVEKVFVGVIVVVLGVGVIQLVVNRVASMIVPSPSTTGLRTVIVVEVVEAGAILVIVIVESD